MLYFCLRSSQNQGHTVFFYVGSLSKFKKPELEKEFKSGDRISYASRVYDEKEMCSLVDSALDFLAYHG